MANIVYYSEEFKKNLKPLAKKYISIKEATKTLEDDLIVNPWIALESVNLIKGKKDNSND